MPIHPSGGSGGGGGSTISVPANLRFSGATLSACKTARDAYFASNPTLKKDQVVVSLEPTGASVVLSKWSASGSAWLDITSVIKGDKGDKGDPGVAGAEGPAGPKGDKGDPGSGTGSGDMLKSTYDPDGDGRIDYGQLSGLGTAALKSAPVSGDATAGQVVMGNDSRLTDSRVPLNHIHDIAATIGLATALAGKVDRDGAKQLSDENYTTSEKIKLGNLTDNFKGFFANATARNAANASPAAGNYCLQEDTNSIWYYSSGGQWVNTGSTSIGNMLKSVYDPTAKNADAFLMSNMVETTTAKVMTDAERTKLAGIATSATANATDATLLDRANHTGTQAISTVSGLQAAIDAKQATLVSGTNIKTINGTSLVGAGNIAIAGDHTSLTTQNSVIYDEDLVLIYSSQNANAPRLIKAGALAGGVFNQYDPFRDGTQKAYYSFDASNLLDEDNKLSGDSTYNPLSSVAVTFADGYNQGKCAVFNGSTSIVQLPPGLTQTANNARSIFMWAFLKTAARQALFLSGKHGTANGVFDFEAGVYNGSGVLGRFGIHYWGDGITSAATVDVGQWTHIGVVHYGGALSAANTIIYKNGVGYPLQGTATFDTSSATSCMYGGRVVGSSYNDIFVNGSLDQMRVFNRALSPAEVLTLYNSKR